MSLPEQVRKQLPALGWNDYDGWWLAAGTGTTLAGLVLGEQGARPVYGALAVPDDHGVAPQVAAILQQAGLVTDNYRLCDASRGGFAKVDETLLGFMAECEAASGLPLEPLYSAKALLLLKQQVAAGQIAPGSRLIFVHTGGLQGRRGFAQPA